MLGSCSAGGWDPKFLGSGRREGWEEGRESFGMGRDEDTSLWKREGREVAPSGKTAAPPPFSSFFPNLLLFIPTFPSLFPASPGWEEGRTRKREEQEFAPSEKPPASPPLSLLFFPKLFISHPNLSQPFSSHFGVGKGRSREEGRAGEQQSRKREGQEFAPAKRPPASPPFSLLFSQPFRFPSRPFSSQSGWLRSGNSSSR